MTNKRYIIHGLSRSGNHAIIFWLIHNLVESVELIGNSIYIDQKRSLCYINNYNIYEGMIKTKFPDDLFATVIKSYEDIEFNQDTSLIVLRDFGNLLASRYRRYCPSIGLNTNYICDLLRLIQTWKQHTRSPKRTILYNKWLVSKPYRDQMSIKILGVPNINDRIDFVSDIGDGSSFNEERTRQKPDDYLSRYKQVRFPKYIIDHVLSDDELLDLNHRLFGIDMKEMSC